MSPFTFPVLFVLSRSFLINCSYGLFYQPFQEIDRKSTRLNSSHANISYAVFCLNKKNALTDEREVDADTTTSAAERELALHLTRHPEPRLVAHPGRVIRTAHVSTPVPPRPRPPS